jgi:L-threonine kinase
MLATAQPLDAKPAIYPTSSLYLKAPGTCGELMQGAIDEQDFLVNCPINLFSHSTVQASGKAGLQLHHCHRHTKIRDTIMLAAEEFAFDVSHSLEIHSDVPRGKGMASSSADITAAFEAVCRQCDATLTAEEFAHIVTEIEPSDCVHFPGIAHVNHLTGHLFESMPAPRGMSILVVDCGGHIDTVAFDRLRARNLYREHQAYFKAALAMLKDGLYNGDLAAVAEAATRSAQFNQQIHCKPQFEELLTTSRAIGALGVNCAHSGTVLGVLYRSDDELKERLINNIELRFGTDINIIGNFHIISGGCYEY